jgi:hypothetical protein
MKKVLLTMLAGSAMLFGISQTTLSVAPFPCVKYFATGNLGGGDCPTTGTGNNKHYPGYLDITEKTGYVSTGKITIYFKDVIPAGTPAPMIISAGVDDGSGNIVAPAFDYYYAAYNDNLATARTSVVYCYYSPASNQNIFNGSKAPVLAFKIQYQGYDPNTCGGVTPVPITLPVLFQSFSATRNSQSVSIKWETATEVNNRGFYIQRNVNGEWKDVAFVFSKADGGNSNQVLSYAYNDPNALSTVSYYRILQVDLDGRAKFSDTRIIKGLGEVSKLLMFPNPGTSGTINVMLQDEVAPKNIIIYDATGRAVKSFKNFVNASLTIDRLKPGVYNIQVINTTTQVVSSDKFIIKD